MNPIQHLPKSAEANPIRQFFRARHRDFVFALAMQRFLRNPEDSLQPQNTVLSDLIYGWGNEDWSALNDYLVSCIHHALHTNGPILECGSGLSTLLVGAIAQRRGLRHWALEHTPAWAEKVQSYLNRYQIDAVQLCTHPLKDYGDFEWYVPDLEMMPEFFDLVICDGPPGTTKGGRYGLVPVMRAKLGPGCLILLDDAGRESELMAAKAWSQALNVSFEWVDCLKPYIKIRLAKTHP